LLLTTRDGRPVYVKDVAEVVVGAAEPERRAWTITRAANGDLQRRPAVTLAVAKRKGANAVTVADDVLKRLENRERDQGDDGDRREAKVEEELVRLLGRGRPVVARDGDLDAFRNHAPADEAGARVSSS